MNKIETFNAMINAPTETRQDRIDDRAAAWGVSANTLNKILTCYCTAIRRNYAWIDLTGFFGKDGADIAEILRQAQVHDVMITESSSATLPILNALIRDGWWAAAADVIDSCGETVKGLKLTRGL